MLNFDKYIRFAGRYAIKSNHYQYKLVALVIRSGKVISVGYNLDHTHAEDMAINRGWRSNLNGCELMVLRFKNDGSIGMARPCDLCMERIKLAGIKRIYYSDYVPGIRMMKMSSEAKLKPEQLSYHFIKPLHKPKVINRYS